MTEEQRLKQILDITYNLIFTSVNLTDRQKEMLAAKEIAGYGWGAYMHDPETGEELLPKKYPWVEVVQNNKEKHIKAIYDGYTVEQPKRWVVKFEQDNEQFYFNSWMHVYSTQPIGYARKEVDNVIKFTDKKKAEAVATLVEGSVEEI